MIFLWERDRDNDDGLLQYVRQCLLAGDLSWFPSHTSLVLQNLQKEQEEKGEGELKEMESRLSMQMQAKHGAMASQIEHLTKLVEQLGGSGGGGGGGGSGGGAVVVACRIERKNEKNETIERNNGTKLSNG